MNSFNPSQRIQRIRKKRVLEVMPYIPKFDYEKEKGLERYSFNIRLSVLRGITLNQAGQIISGAPNKKPYHAKTWLKQEKIDALVNYPLNQWYRITIPYTLGMGKPMSMSLGHLCWYVAKAYSDEIYANQKKYGVWGHNMSDLHIEGIYLKPFKRKTYAIMEFGS